MFTLRKRHAAVIAALVLGSGFLLARNSVGGPSASTAAAPAIAVDVATVELRKITDWHEYSGRLEAVDRVEIRPLVSGTLVKVHFKDGALVKRGDPLFTIDPRPYQAAVDEAQARLAAATAKAAYTSADLARGQRLLAGNAIARRDFEEKRNASREAAANVEAARAALQSARLDLEHTRIVAPIAGRVSRAEVTEGNIVSAGGAQPLTTVVSVARIYASFEMDEPTFLQTARGTADGASPDVPVAMGLANETGYPRTGRLASLDNRLDPRSGTMRVRAVFDNPDGLLRPGLYARIRVGSGPAHDAVLLAEKAIGTDQAKRFVLLVDKANKVVYREVTLGAGRNGQRVIESGLRAGDRVVVSGMQRVRPGDVVAPESDAGKLASGDPGGTPDDSASPAPHQS
ncbi:MAG TPA: efflux RND transporter periplasmic adaptor subunit [Castellaniella sp.]|nr:efflux RND transporter periplasmic adaptor subunit [Castellaniella sp.]